MPSQSSLAENQFYYWTGLAFLGLARTKAAFKGYSSPKPFSATDQCLDYDLQVVNGWLAALERYVGHADFLAGKSVLELGPGSDLGTGVTLLSRGAGSYSAFDVNDLAIDVPPRFYEALIARLCQRDSTLNGDQLLRDLSQPDRFAYLCRPDCDLSAVLGPRTIDVVFSQAALEHFEDIERTVRQVSQIVRPGGILVAEIDLTTHSRWIRDRDPLNIYRYSDAIYSLFTFSGAPNRLRPADYRNALRDNGWVDISITPLRTLGRSVTSGLASRFQSDGAEMEALSIMVCATRSNA